MKIDERYTKVLGWLMKALAILAVPALLPASVGMGQRVGWVGAVLVWLYIGRVMNQNPRIEE